MKRAGIIALILTILTSVSFAQTITVEGDKNLDKDVSNFKTFGWTSQVDNSLDEGLYFLNDLVLKAEIRNAVEAELRGLGYEKTSENPDMVVNFRVFEKPVTLRGFEGMGTTYWDQTTVRDPESVTEYEVEAGTIMVHLVDRRTGEIIWHGFASGLIDNNKFLKDSGKIREAVNLVFEEFGERATEYTRR